MMAFTEVFLLTGGFGSQVEALALKFIKIKFLEVPIVVKVIPPLPAFPV